MGSINEPSDFGWAVVSGKVKENLPGIQSNQSVGSTFV